MDSRRPPIILPDAGTPGKVGKRTRKLHNSRLGTCVKCKRPVYMMTIYELDKDTGLMTHYSCLSPTQMRKARTAINAVTDAASLTKKLKDL